ncbi:MAG: dihydroorotase [Gammaproteobacteria bacterium]|nr:dihydroorotase [Gammaproteobacteria bacterium]
MKTTPTASLSSLTIIQPDDWHLHLRDGDAMRAVLVDTARQFARAIVMPNLKPPVTSTAQAIAYRERIIAARPQGSTFEPLMVLYLTDMTQPEEIARAKASGVVRAAKYYPAGATTNSENGVTDLTRIYPVLAAMEKHDLPLLLHGEVTDAEIDVFDRERVFIEKYLVAIVEHFPGLRVVLEHVTTQDAVQFVMGAPDNVAATITAHHLLFNRNAMFQGGIRPHYYCLPILKREVHRLALVRAATSHNKKFFLGTDSAPHARHTKETSCGCAGIYTAHAAMELYAEAFEKANALDALEDFASHYGADFYKLPRNQNKITLRKESWTVPQELSLGGQDSLVPLRAGENIEWKLNA